MVGVKQQHVLVTGGTGFIGVPLCEALLTRGYHVTVLSRDAQKARARLHADIQIISHLEALATTPSQSIPVDILINLAGESLADRRWNSQRKDEFFRSRVDFTRQLFNFFSKHAQDSSATGEAGLQPPKLLINGSAIGFYGDQKGRVLDEAAAAESVKSRGSFSHRLCAAWEEAANQFHSLGTRVCTMRTGIVLGANGGALARMLPPFRLGLGGPIGDGSQWMSWIHRDDLVALFLHCIKRTDISGPVNGAAPNPVTNKVFSRTLGKVLHRPAILPMPAFVVRLLFGEMADELLLASQRLQPRKALETGFQFRYPELEGALEQILSSR